MSKVFANDSKLSADLFEFMLYTSNFNLNEDCKFRLLIEDLLVFEELGIVKHD